MCAEIIQPQGRNYRSYRCVCENQEFREIGLPSPDQGVTLPVTYDRNASAKPPHRLCPRQHLGPNPRRQLEQLRAAGCTKIYREKVTGAHSDRRELLKMLKHLAPGDIVTVTRIDRLARSTFDLFAIVKQIVDAEAQFRSLAEPWADTGTSTGRLMIAVLGGLADVERDLIRTRTAEGRARRRSAGSAWAGTEIDRRTAGRGPATTRGGCHAGRTRAQLPCRQEYDFSADHMRQTPMADFIYDDQGVCVARIINGEIFSELTKRRIATAREGNIYADNVVS